MDNINENTQSKPPEQAGPEVEQVEQQYTQNNEVQETEPKQKPIGEKQRNKYSSGLKHNNDSRHPQGYHHMNHQGNSNQGHRTNSVSYYRHNYQGNKKKNSLVGAASNQKYAYKKKNNAHDTNEHVIGKINQMLKGKNHNQLFFIHPYEKCSDFSNYSTFLNLNLKFLKQSYKMKETYEEDSMNEFSVLHSNQGGNNNQLNQLMYMMMNNQSNTNNANPNANPNANANANAGSAKQNNAHLNASPGTKNYQMNQMVMFYNMLPQFNKTKMFMLQNQTFMQYMLQQQNQMQNQNKTNNQSQQQQHQQQQMNLKSSMSDPNIQNILNLTLNENFAHPYPPLSLQNPMFNLPINLQGNTHNNMNMNYTTQQDNYIDNAMRTYLYTPEPKAIEENLATGRYLKGTIRMNKSLTHGYITVPGLANDILIRGRNLNQSINLDEVIVELFSIACWKPLVNKRVRKISMIPEEKEEINVNEYNTDIEADDTTKGLAQLPGEKITAAVDDSSNSQGEYKEIFITKEERLKYINSVYHLRPEGRIVKILKSPNSEKEQICHIEIQNSQLFAYPIDESVPKIFIKSKKNKRNEANEAMFRNKYLMVKIIGWAMNYKCPKGLIVNEIGFCGNIKVETEVLLRSYNIDYTENFSFSIIEEIQSKMASLVIDDDFIRESGRVDLRNDIIFTVDPKESKDLDDAISVKLIDKEKGLLEIGVHIADPSYFVTKESLLDKEALNRATTIYLVQNNIPMLPRELSENVCSLMPNQDRLAITCSFRIYFNGALDDAFTPKFELSVINSKAKWNYDLVQQIIEGENIQYDELSEAEGIKPKSKEIFNQILEATSILHKLTSTVRGQRYESGSLLIYNTDFGIKLDEKTNMPLGFKTNERSESHNLIEELMLIANKLTAEFLYSNIKYYSMIRRHPSLNDNKFSELKRYLISNGINIESKEPHELNNKLNGLKQNKQKFICIQRKLKTFMLKAEYVLSNHYCFSDLKHSALNFELYTHFTSPIRRYPDLIVHRQIKAILEANKQKLTKEKCKELFQCYEGLIESLNEKYYNGKQISDKSKRIFKCIYLKNNKELQKKEYTAFVVDISEKNYKKQSIAPDILTISLYIEELHLELDWKKEDNENIINANHKSNSNELILDYKTEENKVGNKVIKIFDSVTIILRVIDTVPLDVKCSLKLE